MRKNVLATGVVSAAIVAGCVPFVLPAQAVASDPSVTFRAQSWITPGQEQGFFSMVLAAIAAPSSNENLQVMQAWAAAEGSYLAYNPWNTTQRAPGSTLDKNGSTRFADAASAVSATSRQLLSLYPGIVAGFRASNPEATIQAIVVSPWASGHYFGATNYQASSIYRAYRSLLAGWVRNIPGAAGVTGAPGVVPNFRRKVGVSTISMTWRKANGNGNKITKYQVSVRRMNANGTWRPTVRKTLGKAARASSWVGLQHGKQHEVSVRAKNKLGWGPWSVGLPARP